MPSMLALIVIFVSITNIVTSHQSLNEYDTYYADECQRIRRPWHELTRSERDLYISGLLKIRENGQQNIDIDELIAIGSVHADKYAPFIHKTSSYLFWHGYLTWELESRIRALGGKYKCFGMPYWDFTLEAGRESDPLIFHTGLGGNGDINNHHQVNQYSWPYTTKQYWTPTDCYTETDQYPICSLKRSLRQNFEMPTAGAIGDNIINNPDFIDFAQYSHISGQAVHLIDDDTFDDESYEFTQSYEPIWYLFHSMIQYHQAIWTDCNEYDKIPVGELEKYPEAFQAFCNSWDTCTVNNNGYPERWLQWELDDPMHFGGKLIKHEWSYINKQDLTVRKLYNLPKWNIVYDLGNGKGFYTDSGLKDYCNGKLNESWFILEEDVDDGVVESVDEEEGGLSYGVILVCLGLSILVGVYYLCMRCVDGGDGKLLMETEEWGGKIGGYGTMETMKSIFVS